MPILQGETVIKVCEICYGTVSTDCESGASNSFLYLHELLGNSLGELGVTGGKSRKLLTAGFTHSGEDYSQNRIIYYFFYY